jgi:hypothetical protein
MVQEVLAEVSGVAELIAELWWRYPKGLVAHLQEEVVPKVEELAHYIQLDPQGHALHHLADAHHRRPLFGREMKGTGWAARFGVTIPNSSIIS